MNAIVLDGIGLPLALREVPEPVPAAGEARVQIKAAALNHRDWWIQKGQYAGLKFPCILGSDGCGILVDNIPGISSGQEVILNPALAWGSSNQVQAKSFHILGLPTQGTFAEYIAIPTKNIAQKPKHLSSEQAAALPLAGLTAYRATISRGQAAKGKRILINGIGGGVALFALKFALAVGAEVWVTSGKQEKIDKALDMGASGGTLYTQPNWGKKWAKEGILFDLVVDGAGGNVFNQLIEVAAPGGIITTYGGTQGPVNELFMQKIFYKQLSILGCTMGSPAEFAQMLDLVNEHKIIPVVSTALSMEEAEQGIRLIDNATQFGKIVLKW